MTREQNEFEIGLLQYFIIHNYMQRVNNLDVVSLSKTDIHTIKKGK